MLRFFLIAMVFMTMSCSDASSDCNKKDTLKLIDAGYSKNEISDICGQAEKQSRNKVTGKVIRNQSAAPGTDKIKADLVGLNVCNWRIDSIREFRKLKIVDQTTSSEIIEYDLEIKVEAGSDDRLMSARAIYKKRDGEWLLSNLLNKNCTSTKKIAEQKRLEAEQKRLEAERIAEQKRLEAERIAEQKRIEDERKRLKEEARKLYTDHGDSTITDKKTGLMWKQCVEGFSGSKCSSGKEIELEWKPAIDHGERAVFAGYSDWRLPSKDELLTLVDKRYKPMIHPVAFPNTGGHNFWSSTPPSRDLPYMHGFPWEVGFQNGTASEDRHFYTRRVRLVRDGQAAIGSGAFLVAGLTTGKSRFSVTDDGVISDSKTGLDWLIGPDKDTDYKSAEQWIAGLDSSHRGGNWRMPVLHELKSLYHKGIGKRNIDPAFMTTGWSVWAKPFDMTLAWIFYYRNGDEYKSTRSLSDGNRVFGVRSRPR